MPVVLTQLKLDCKHESLPARHLRRPICEVHMTDEVLQLDVLRRLLHGV